MKQIKLESKITSLEGGTVEFKSNLLVQEVEEVEEVIKEIEEESEQELQPLSDPKIEKANPEDVLKLL